MTASSSSKRPDPNKQSSAPMGSRLAPRALGAVLVLGLCAAGALTWYLMQEHEKAELERKKATTYASASAADSALAEAEKALVSCLSGVALPELPPIKQFDKLLAQGSYGKYAVVGRRIKQECTPAFRKTLSTIDATLELPAWNEVNDAARAFADRADQYADTFGAHAAIDQTDHRMMVAADAWSTSEGRDETSLRFESFLICALPDPRARVNTDSFFKWTAVNCTQDGTYSERLRSECAPKLDARDDHPTDSEYAVLETLRHAKVPKTTMGVASYMLLGCSERTRREWVGVDAKPLSTAFAVLSTSRQALTDKIASLKPHVPQS